MLVGLIVGLAAFIVIDRAGLIPILGPVFEVLTPVLAGVGSAVVEARVAMVLDRPTVNVDVLPHKRGFQLPPKELKKDYFTGPDFVPLIGGPYTHPEAADAKNSQLWDAYLQEPRSIVIHNPKPGDKIVIQLLPLVVKFGVLRVTCTKGDVQGLHAKIEFRRVAQGAEWTQGERGWTSLGSLGWYSDSIRQLVLGEKRYEVHDNWSSGLNSYLRNPEIDLNEGESRDLPLFYMRIGGEDGRGDTRVHICGEAVGIVAGIASLDTAVKFELRVELFGNKLRERTRIYRCTVKTDDFRIEHVPTNSHWWNGSD